MYCRVVRPVVGLLVVSTSVLVPALCAQTLTLDDALAHAWAEHPDVRLACAELRAAQADLLDARVYPYNPEIELEGADRRGPDDSTTDRGLTVSQRFELGGQRGRRTATARAALAETESRVLRRLRQHRAEVERTFVDALAARERMQVAKADLALTEELLDFEQKRLDAGAGTALDVRLTRAAVGRATREVQLARAADAEARSRWARATGWATPEPPKPAGRPAPPPHPVDDLETLVARAMATRSDLTALDRHRESARSRLALERSRSVPDLVVSAFTAREEGDDVTGLGLGVSIPLFDRNQGGVARAESEILRADARRAGAELELRRDVAAARTRTLAAERAFEVLDTLVVESLEETLDLLERAFREGEVSATDVLVLRRELVEGRREYVEAARDLRAARIELDLTTGSLDVPPVEEVCHASD